MDLTGFSFILVIEKNRSMYTSKGMIRLQKSGWLDPIRLHNSGGFSRVEISNILRIIEHRQETMMEAWNDFFSS